MPRYSPNINVMMKAVKKAARGLVRDFGEVENLQVSQKGPSDFVSAADIRSEEILFEELQKARPEFGFVLEESGKVKGKDAEFRWIVDPLDGTSNFLHGLPQFCISVAMEQRQPNGEREVVAAITYAPLQKEMFWAEKGQGAWLENASDQTHRLRVAARKRLNSTLVVVGSLKRDMAITKKMIDQVGSVRCLGSTTLAMAYVAAGRVDAFCQQTTLPWDIAAGLLLVREAGGSVADLSGNERGLLSAEGIFATNCDLLHKYLDSFG